MSPWHPYSTYDSKPVGGMVLQWFQTYTGGSTHQHVLTGRSISVIAVYQMDPFSSQSSSSLPAIIYRSAHLHQLPICCGLILLRFGPPKSHQSWSVRPGDLHRRVSMRSHAMKIWIWMISRQDPWLGHHTDGASLPALLSCVISESEASADR